MDTIFLVDDDPAVRTAFSRILRDAGWKVEDFDSAEAFRARQNRATRGCLVLDVTMPGLDGLELQRELSQAGESLPIVFVTGHGDIPMSVQAIKRGAVDFLTKPVSSQELLDAVRAAVEQDALAGDARIEMAEFQRRLSNLTEREREVLAGVVNGKLNKQIAADLEIVEQTVKYHRARIMVRMQAHTVAELMHIASKLGIEGVGWDTHAERDNPAPKAEDS